MHFKTKRDLRFTIMYFVLFITSIILSALLLKGIINNPTGRDIFLDILGLIVVIFAGFMFITIFLINYTYFDLEKNELCSKSGIGYMARYKFKFVKSVKRKRKAFSASALSTNTLEIIILRDKKEGELVLYVSPEDEKGFLKALKEYCRNVKIDV